MNTIKLSGLAFIAALILVSCGSESSGEWFAGEFHATQPSNSHRMNQVYFSNNEDGLSDIYLLSRGISLQQYKGEWQIENDTIILAVSTRKGDRVEEARLVRDSGSDLVVVSSNLFPNLQFSNVPVTEREEDDNFLNTLFLISEINGQAFEIAADEDPVFLYFEEGNQDFIIARAFLGCQVSSSSIAPRPDQSNYRIYPFPSIRDSDCKQLATEKSVREVYRTADNFLWENNSLLIMSGENAVMKLKALGPVNR